MSGFLCSMVGATFTVAAAAEIIRKKQSVIAFANAQIDTAQSKFGGASAYFDGVGDRLQVATNDGIFFTGDFTIELWFRPGNESAMLFGNVATNVSPNAGQVICYYASSTGGFQVYFNGQSAMVDNTAMAINNWHHFALVRSGSTVKAYVNGTEQTSTKTVTGDIGTVTYPTWYLAGLTNDADCMLGHMDEIRFSNSARYTANFTPSTTPFVNDANTLLLIHADGTDASTFFEDDNGVRAPQGIIANVNAQVDTAQSKFGGSSLYVNSYSPGNGSSLYIPDIKDQVKWGTTGKSFTAECWARWTQFPNPSLASTAEGAFPLINLCRNTQGYVKWCFGVNDQGYLGTDYTLSWASYGGMTQYDTSAALSLNTWYHIAFVWDEVADSIRIYRDGVLKLNITNPLGGYTLNWAGEGAGPGPFGVFIGAHYWGQEVHIDDLRFSDSARYTTSNFTAPTAPFVNDANTLILIHGDGTDAATVFRDDNGARAPKGISALGNAQIDTAQSKFGGASALFDGSGDYLTAYSIPALTGDLTMEFWYRHNTFPAQAHFIEARVSGEGSVNKPLIYRAVDNTIRIYYNGSFVINTAWTPSSGVWYHIAVVRSSGSVKIYINGSQVGSTWSNSDTWLASDYTIGDSPGGGYGINGHLDEVRISNTARYTAAFTAPTAPFQNDANTLLLLHMDGTDASTVFTDDNGIAPYTP